MAISPQLAQFKSSGVYRLEFDKSQTVNIPAETIRLVVGYSNKGPANTPMYIPDTSFFQDVYGPIDRKLERLGHFFHRSALTALERGPILALNLHNIGAGDTVDALAVDADATFTAAYKIDGDYQDFYNREKFWYPEDEAMLNAMGVSSKLLNFVNLKQDPITILVKKSENTAGFEIEAQEWYGVGNVPEFIADDDLISDYLIEVAVLKGDWSADLSSHAVFGDYFDANGLLYTTMDEFFNLSQVTVLGRYEGNLIPDFVDGDGNSMSLEDSINFETSKTGLFCAIDDSKWDTENPVAMSATQPTSYDMNNLDGFAAPGTDNFYNPILGTNLFKALINKDEVSFRYVVDTFSNGTTAESTLSKLAKARQNAFAICNAPSVATFKASADYVDSSGTVSPMKISENYAFPSITDGANYSGWYGPHIIVKDKGKSIKVPPAAYISNNFIDKYTAATPWAIIAGPRRGVVGGTGVVGLEVNFDREDRDFLEPFGYNPIIFQRGVGLTITGNKTAQQSVKSALSSVHVREVLIYIEDGMAAILKNYLFEFNTAQTRLEIKTLADSFMNTVKAEGGVYDFRNVMDSTNNSNEVVDANMGILDTFVEPVKGLEILVHRTTVLKTGGIATGQYV